MSLVRWVAGVFASVAAPFGLVFVGAVLTGVAVDYEIEFLVWTGLVLCGCGVLWGVLLFLFAAES